MTRARLSGAAAWSSWTSTTGLSTTPESAARAVASMGDADMALLVNHGVLVTAGSIRAAHQRSVALEYRSRRAWEVEAVGTGRELPDPARSFFPASDGEGFIGFFEAMARQVLREDPTLLDSSM